MNVQDSLSAFEQAGAGGRRRPVPAVRARAVAYVRVSTDEQHLGPEAQERAIREYATRAGYELAAVYRDVGVSGAAPLDERPGLAAALEGIALHQATILICARRDRLSRDLARVVFVERLVERAQARVETADGIAGGTGPEDKLLRAMLDAMAEYERTLIRMRTRSALAVKRARGEVSGNVPYGWRDVDGRLVEDPEEQKAVAFILAKRKEGLAYQAIADAANAAGLPARGSKWHLTTCQRICKAHNTKAP